MDAFFVKSVDDRFHGNIAGQVPVIAGSLFSVVQMAEQTVKHHVEVSPVYINSPPAVKTAQMVRIIIDQSSVGPQPCHGRVRLKSQTAERQIQKMHIQVQFVAGTGKNPGTQFHHIQFLKLAVSDRIDHRLSFPPVRLRTLAVSLSSTSINTKNKVWSSKNPIRRL